MSTPSRLFAVIPAAGCSRRMGRPKLLLPLGDETVIARQLRLLERPEIEAVVVVVRPDDEPLRAEVAAHRGIALQPVSAPPEMRDSVEYALRWVDAQYHPAPDDGWLLCPADHPLIEKRVLDLILERWRGSKDQILIPTCRGKRGHPVLMRWSLVPEVFALSAEVGLNALVRNRAGDVAELEVGRESVIADLDTPEDYERVLRESGKPKAGSGRGNDECRRTKDEGRRSLP